MRNLRHPAWLPWAAIGLLTVLCGGLAVLQYQWIGEIAGAERTRLREALQAHLTTLSRALNDELTTAANALMPAADVIEGQGREAAYSAQYLRARDSHDRLFRRIGIAVPSDADVQLLLLDSSAARFAPADWPAEWTGLRESFRHRLQGGPPRPMAPDNSAIFELPRFTRRDEHSTLEADWLILEVDTDYVTNTILPDLLNRHLGESGRLEYDAQIVENYNPSVVLYRSPGTRGDITEGRADASVPLLDIRFAGFGDRGGRGGPGRGFGRGPGAGPDRGPHPEPGFARGPRLGRGGPPDSNQGRWRLLVRHRAGSLEALVARTRLRNLWISAAVLGLILATVALMLRYSRQTARLAQQQMNFVAGVSHELRTPLTVIRTAAFNLRGKLATRPDQVERYGALIQAESEKLAALMEQVLRFASMEAGHIIRNKEPVAVEALVEEGLRSSRAALAAPGLVVEKKFDAGVPLVLADGMALRHAVQNLMDNALKYGTEGSNWIGLFVSAANGQNGPSVEIRVADHGPGIPQDELEHIFDPFFRGRRAIQDQVHGTGLGLNLVKKIVEAHGGTIKVKSQPMNGTEFIIRIPAAPPELQDEFAHTAD
jgi:signal transduction histidine kinase